MTDKELGFWFAVTNGGAGLLGGYLGGELAHRFARNNEPLQLKWMAVAVVVSTIMLEAVFLTHDRGVALWWMSANMVVGVTVNGPLFAILMTIVPQHMRATSTAILNFLSNLIGMGLGPLAAGALSDHFHPVFGDESLRYVLLVLTPGYLWAAWHTWAPHKTVLNDVRMAELDMEGTPEEEAGASAPAH
jgi:MFS family permease